MTPRILKFKGLKRENLRDHMNDLELFSLCLEVTEIAKIKMRKGC